MKLGIIGSGMMGSTLGPLWAKAGHDVLYSSRHPETLEALASATPRAQATTVEVAARDSQALFLGVPYAAMPEVAATLAPHVAGKLVLDAGNIIPNRDGALARTIAQAGTGSGSHTASLLPGARVVKAFNTIHFRSLATRTGTGALGVPLAGDDAGALEEAAALVRDAGFEPVPLPGGLAASARLDFGQPVWNSNMNAAQLRLALGL